MQFGSFQVPEVHGRGISDSDLTLLERTSDDELSRLDVEGGGAFANRGGHLGPRRLSKPAAPYER